MYLLQVNFHELLRLRFVIVSKTFKSLRKQHPVGPFRSSQTFVIHFIQVIRMLGDHLPVGKDGVPVYQTILP